MPSRGPAGHARAFRGKLVCRPPVRHDPLTVWLTTGAAGRLGSGKPRPPIAMAGPPSLLLDLDGLKKITHPAPSWQPMRLTDARTYLRIHCRPLIRRARYCATKFLRSSCRSPCTKKPSAWGNPASPPSWPSHLSTRGSPQAAASPSNNGHGERIENFSPTPTPALLRKPPR